MYRIPEFPLLCDIYDLPPPVDFVTRVFRLQSVCQLRLFGREKPLSGSPTPGGNLLVVGSSILFPAGTDVRDGSCLLGTTDLIECPPTSGRWYIVTYVDDVARGFPNEYRFAAVDKVIDGINYPNFPMWPTPIP